MNYKYWLLLSLAPVAAALPASCSGKFDTCEARRKCPVGAGGAKASNDGSSAGEAGDQQPNSEGGSGGADETSGGAAGETADGADGGTAGEGGESCVAAAGSADCNGVCTPGQQDCSSNGVRTCDASGQYGAPSKCTNKTCVASGTTASCVGNCEPAQTQCSGNSIQSCGANGAWAAAAPCAAATPICASNACQAPVSCSGLPANCGTSNESCCTSPLVTGGSFKRDNDANFPATVSTFRLDKYEVTVGRFRKFVAAVVGGWTPAAGAGKHTHLNDGAGLKNSAAAGYETGWDPQWSVDELPTNKATWDGSNALGCNADYQTWTSSSGNNETRPINCVSWFKAVAFCIWDGGFLPSEAEWNYAAVGGSAQRAYPWGLAAPGMNANLAVYGCYLNGTGTCSGVTNIAPVGSVPVGNGLFGQADLAGNVWEHNLDGMANYTATCNDCAYWGPPTETLPSRRGGAYAESLSDLASASRNSYPAWWNGVQQGLRCARIP